MSNADECDHVELISSVLSNTILDLVVDHLPEALSVCQQVGELQRESL